MVYGDRGYRGCEGVIVCDSREMRAKRHVPVPPSIKEDNILEVARAGADIFVVGSGIFGAEDIKAYA